jgi:hypothetical protein
VQAGGDIGDHAAFLDHSRAPRIAFLADHGVGVLAFWTGTDPRMKRPRCSPSC